MRMRFRKQKKRSLNVLKRDSKKKILKRDPEKRSLKRDS